MEELEYELAEWLAHAEREKLEESKKSPHDYFDALEEDGEEKTHLYRCYDNQDQLLYLGVSLSAFRRFIQHKTRSKWAKDVVKHIYIEYFDSRDLALAAEEEAIKTEYPKFNIQHNHGKRPWGHGRSTVCSFKYQDNNGKFVTGIRIGCSPYSYEPDLVTDEMDEQIFNIAGNALQLYRIICFKPWQDKVIEIEVNALMYIFGIKYHLEDFECFWKLVIDQALEMITNYSEKHLTYTTKKTEGYITHIVFKKIKNTPHLTYLEVLADRLGINSDDLSTTLRTADRLGLHLKSSR